MARRPEIKFSTNVEQEIVLMYENGRTLSAIKERYNIVSDATVYKVLDKWQTPRRKPDNKGGRNKLAVKRMKCSCGHQNPTNSKFCNQCGKTLKTHEEIVLDGLLNARSKCLRYVNQGIRDDVDAQIMAAVELIKKTFDIKE